MGKRVYGVSNEPEIGGIRLDPTTLGTVNFLHTAPRSRQPTMDAQRQDASPKTNNNNNVDESDPEVTFGDHLGSTSLQAPADVGGGTHPTEPMDDAAQPSSGHDAAHHTGPPAGQRPTHSPPAAGEEHMQVPSTWSPPPPASEHGAQTDLAKVDTSGTRSADQHAGGVGARQAPIPPTPEQPPAWAAALFGRMAQLADEVARLRTGAADPVRAAAAAAATVDDDDDDDTATSAATATERAAERAAAIAAERADAIAAERAAECTDAIAAERAAAAAAERAVAAAERAAAVAAERSAATAAARATTAAAIAARPTASRAADADASDKPRPLSMREGDSAAKAPNNNNNKPRSFDDEDAAEDGDHDDVDDEKYEFVVERLPHLARLHRSDVAEREHPLTRHDERWTQDYANLERIVRDVARVHPGRFGPQRSTSTAALENKFEAKEVAKEHAAEVKLMARISPMLERMEQVAELITDWVDSALGGEDTMSPASLQACTLALANGIVRLRTMMDVRFSTLALEHQNTVESKFRVQALDRRVKPTPTPKAEREEQERQEVLRLMAASGAHGSALAAAAALGGAGASAPTTSTTPTTTTTPTTPTNKPRGGRNQRGGGGGQRLDKMETAIAQMAASLEKMTQSQPTQSAQPTQQPTQPTQPTQSTQPTQPQTSAQQTPQQPRAAAGKGQNRGNNNTTTGSAPSTLSSTGGGNQ